MSRGGKQTNTSFKIREYYNFCLFQLQCMIERERFAPPEKISATASTKTVRDVTSTVKDADLQNAVLNVDSFAHGATKTSNLNVTEA